MLSLNAMLTAQTAPASTDAPLANGTNPQETADFAAIVAQQAQITSTDPTQLAITAPVVDPAMVAGNDLPASGKGLPVASKIAAPVAELATLTATLLDQLNDGAGAEKAAEVPTDGDQPANTAAAPAEIASQMQNPLAALVAPIIIANPAPAQPALDAPRAPAGERAAPQTPVAQAPAAPRLAPGQDQPVAPLPVLQVTAPPAAVQAEVVAALRDTPRYAPPPRLAATLKVRTAETGEPIAPLRAPAGDNLLPAMAPLASDAAQPLALNPSSTGSAAQPQPALAATATVAAPRPHDFAQLIDRLVAAREAVQPHPVAVTLAHAEFGKVELRFANDTGGLTVAMASPDPDFARAVQIATPPAQSSSTGTSTGDQGGSQARPGNGGGTGFASSQDFAGNGSNHTATDRRSPQARPQANPTPARRDSDGTEHGIFA